MKYLKVSLIVFMLVTILLMTNGTASASTSVTVIEFKGIQTCQFPDMTPYMTPLPSGNIQVKDWPTKCTNEVYDVITGALVVPISITHIGYFNALMKPDGTGQYWGDCPGSGWQAHFEGTMTATSSAAFLHGTGKIGGPFEGMMFQMNSLSNASTSGATVLTGRLIIPNDK